MLSTTGFHPLLTLCIHQFGWDQISHPTVCRESPVPADAACVAVCSLSYLGDWFYRAYVGVWSQQNVLQLGLLLIDPLHRQPLWVFLCLFQRLVFQESLQTAKNMVIESVLACSLSDYFICVFCSVTMS